MGLVQYNTKFFQVDHTEVLELHAQKHTNKEISDKLNMTLYMVEKILEYYELTPVKNIDKIDHQMVIELYNQTNKMSEVAKIMGIEDYMVDKILIQNNITKRNVKLELNPEEVIKDYLESRDIKEVAKKYGVSLTPIVKILKNNNIKRKKNPSPNTTYRKVGKKRVKVVLDINEVISLYKEMDSIVGVGEKLNVHPNKIREILIQNNVEMTLLKYIEIGDVFDMLTVVAYGDNTRTSGGASKKMLICKCECGKEVVRSSHSLRNKKNGKISFKSCGCHIENQVKENERKRIEKKLEYERKLKEWELKRIEKEKKRLEYIGKYGDVRYNIGDKKDRFTIIGIEGKHPSKTIRVVCECGTEKTLRFSSFKQSKSCGCFQRERSYKNGLFTSNDKEKELMYARYKNMKRRCYNEKNDNYADYGGRGITVCDRWMEPDGQGFVNFCLDMGPRPGSKYSIDRINNDGNYEPSNCRWATASEQVRNQRKRKRLKVE